MPSPADVASVAVRLGLDATAAEVTGALRRSGIESILLKGAALARRLYGGEGREYGDVDVLVAPGDKSPAQDELERLGFSLVPQPPEILFREESWASVWRRERDGAVVDLHHTLPEV